VEFKVCNFYFYEMNSTLFLLLFSFNFYSFSSLVSVNGKVVYMQARAFAKMRWENKIYISACLFNQLHYIALIYPLLNISWEKSHRWMMPTWTVKDKSHRKCWSVDRDIGRVSIDIYRPSVDRHSAECRSINRVSTDMSARQMPLVYKINWLLTFLQF